MIKQFFRQAWTMMKQQRLFTSIYIAGTAASIAMAMTIFVILYIKLGPLYPEENRDRMLIFTEVVVADDEGRGSIFNPRLKYIEQLKQESKLLKKVGVREKVPFVSDFSHLCEISSDNSSTTIYELPAYVDCDYWQLFNFRFVQGRPFTKEEEHRPVAVITASLAEKLFATTDVVGLRIYIDTDYYSIVGVVEDQRTCLTNTPTAGNIFVSIHHARYYDEERKSLYGDVNEIKEYNAFNGDTYMYTIAEIYNRILQQNATTDKKIESRIYEYWQKAMGVKHNSNFFTAILEYLYLLLAFLLIPALNLCGLISTRMNSRLAEVGVRKAYGATNRQIITQVLYENMLFTTIGAFVGFVLTYIIVYKNCDWIVTLFDNKISNDTIAQGVTFEMLFNPTVIASVLLLTLLMNIASALVPTLLALKKDIIQSLYHRR
ncbi:MAG: ABC transporter permease [Bacteroidaceae bacterium]|nr:ABC transporter permease [Bacteroidaceae bacterium]